MHGRNHFQRSQILVGNLPARQPRGYHTSYLTTCGEGGIGDSPHKTNPSTPIDKYYLSGGKSSTQLTSNLAIEGI